VFECCALCRPLLQALQEELRGRHHQVSVLQEISFQLLLEASEEESVEAKEKVHVISNKLHLLLRQVAVALRSLQERLVGQPLHLLKLSCQILVCFS